VLQIKIDVVEPELFQAGVERATDRIRREVFRARPLGDVHSLRGRPAAARAAPMGSSLPYISAVSIWRSEAERTSTAARKHRPAGEKCRPDAAADALGLQMFHDELAFWMRNPPDEFPDAGEGAGCEGAQGS